MLTLVATILTSFYKIDRKTRRGDSWETGCQGRIYCPSLDPVLDALARFKATHCDFFDCYLAAQAVASGLGIASFDKDFTMFGDVMLWDENNVESSQCQGQTTALDQRIFP